MEFTTAALRFGHSMAGASYECNATCGQGIDGAYETRLPRRNCGARCLRRHTCAQDREAMDGELTRFSSRDRNPSRHPTPWPPDLATLNDYCRRSLVETKTRSFKLIGARAMARNFHRPLAELQIRAATLNRFTAFGTPQTQRMGQVCPGRRVLELRLNCATEPGSSFIADRTGAMSAEANLVDKTFLIAKIDLEHTRSYRQSWGTWRDRRPKMYGLISSHDTAAQADRGGENRPCLHWLSGVQVSANSTTRALISGDGASQMPSVQRYGM